jgi:hypothetical protein
MKATGTAAVVVMGIFFSAVLTSTFFIGCGGHKEEVKQDSVVTDSIVKDSIIKDTVIIEINK